MIEKLNPQNLTRKKGKGSKGKTPLTNAELQRRYRRKWGGRTINTHLDPVTAACFIYLRKEWGMKSQREVMEAAVRFLTVCTRQGLQRIPMEIPPDLEDELTDDITMV